MRKEWTEDLSVGVPEIDKQHRDFIDALNLLLEAMLKGEGKQVTGRMLSFLGEYVEKHFALEEEYMRKFSYDKYQAHKAIHDGFRKEMASLRKEFDEGGPEVKLVIKVEKNMLDWLIKHIHKVDKKLGIFLKEKL